MVLSIRRVTQLLLVGVLSLAVAFPQHLFAQDHVVSSAQLQKDVEGVAAARERSMQQLNGFLSTPQGQKALETVHVSMPEVQKAIASLDNADLARLTARAQTAQNDFAAGRISDRDLIIILVGIAVIILIIVAVR